MACANYKRGFKLLAIQMHIMSCSFHYSKTHSLYIVYIHLPSFIICFWACTDYIVYFIIQTLTSTGRWDCPMLSQWLILLLSDCLHSICTAMSRA